MSQVKIFDIAWQSTGGGPSPWWQYYRIEIYFAGCQRAREGTPCEGCCNSELWQDEKVQALSVDSVVENIERMDLPHYITVVGGEPTDQPQALMELCRKLHQKDYHIIVFTWHNQAWLENNFSQEDLDNIDVWITEPYDKNRRIVDYRKKDGVHNVIGSGNQRILFREPGRFACSIEAGCVERWRLYSKDRNILELKLKNRLIQKNQKWLVYLNEMGRPYQLLFDKNNNRIIKIYCDLNLTYEDAETITVTATVEGCSGVEAGEAVTVNDFCRSLEKGSNERGFFLGLSSIEQFFEEQVKHLVERQTNLVWMKDILLNSNILVFKNHSLAACVPEQVADSNPFLQIFEKDEEYALLVREDIVNLAEGASGGSEYQFIFFKKDGRDVFWIECNLEEQVCKINSMKLIEDYKGLKKAIAEHFNDVAAILEMYAAQYQQLENSSYLDYLQE